MVKDQDIKEFNSFSKIDFVQYFKKFIKDYFPTFLSHEWRESRLRDCTWLRNNIQSASVDDLRNFFVKIHSITSGSGAGERLKHFKKTAHENDMRQLLTFIIKKRLSMPQKYAIGLKDKSQNGEKIKYIGNGLGEIPGWLFPEEYPIINGKFIYVLNFFKI